MSGHDISLDAGTQANRFEPEAYQLDSTAKQRSEQHYFDFQKQHLDSMAGISRSGKLDDSI